MRVPANHEQKEPLLLRGQAAGKTTDNIEYVNSDAKSSQIQLYELVGGLLFALHSRCLDGNG